MKNPIYTHKNIPFYHVKTEAEFSADPYERYDDVVLRQTALHFADDFWGQYPFQSILDYTLNQMPKEQNLRIAEIGCGVGRLIGTLANQYPGNDYYGIDFSYQMLQQANRLWVEGQTIDLDWSVRGFHKIQLAGMALQNLKLGLAKAENLPFEDAALDMIVSSFLIDRLEDPLSSFIEFYRVLKKGGQMIVVSPLNFQKAKSWELFFPVDKLLNQLQIIGFRIDTYKQDWKIFDPFDKNGNGVQWNCVGLIGIKQ